MKLLNFAIISLLAVFSASCNKDNDSSSPEKPSASLSGVYTGKYGFENDAPKADYILKFKSDGTIEEIGQSSGSAIGRGTFTLNGNHISARYTMLSAPFNDYFIEAIYDQAKQTIDGTWGYEAGGTDGGLFSVKKD